MVNRAPLPSKMTKIAFTLSLPAAGIMQNDPFTEQKQLAVFDGESEVACSRQVGVRGAEQPRLLCAVKHERSRVLGQRATSAAHVATSHRPAENVGRR